jgi:hypothetical protein
LLEILGRTGRTKVTRVVVRAAAMPLVLLSLRVLLHETIRHPLHELLAKAGSGSGEKRED